MVSTLKSLKEVFSESLADLEPTRRWLFLFIALSATAIPASIAVAQIFLAAAFLVWIWNAPKISLRALRHPITLPLSICFLTTLLAVLGSGDPLVSAGALKKFCLFSLPYLTLGILTTERRVSIILALMSISAVASALMAVFQYPTSGPLNRVTGFLGHWQTFSGQMMMILILAAAMLLWVSSRWRLYLGVLIICGIGLLLSETRGAWMGGVAALVLLSWFKDRRIVAGLVVLLTVGFLFLPAHLKDRAYSILDMQMESNAARLNMWSTGLRMIQEHPILGVGPNRITALAYDYGGNPKYEPRFFTHLHNNYLQWAAERGIPGLLAWLWLMGRFFFDLFVFLRAEASCIGVSLRKGLIWACIASLTGILLAGLVEFNLGDSEVLMMLLMLLSCAYALCWKPVSANPQAIRAAQG
jgi:O-antigen ligase